MTNNNGIPPQLGFEALNREAKAWAANTRKELISAQAAAGIKRYSGDLARIRYGLKKKYGEVEAISFRFPLHGVYVEHGVGRGNPASNPGRNRKPKGWFDDPIEREIEALALAIADTQASAYMEYAMDDLLKQIKIRK
jgi:hypothetical protein